MGRTYRWSEDETWGAAGFESENSQREAMETAQVESWTPAHQMEPSNDLADYSGDMLLDVE